MAGQVHKRQPFSKLMGPIMHIPFFGLVPYAARWLLHQRAAGSSSDNSVRFHYYFIGYTTVITGVSCLLDALVVLKYLGGKDVGVYKRQLPPSSQDQGKKSS